MASSIQECGNMTAKERRERRKQRILAKELEKSTSDSVETAVENSTTSSIGTAVENLSERTAVGDLSARTAVANSTTGSAETLDFSHDSDKITYVAPKYVDYVEKSRFWIAILIGVLLSIASMFTDKIGSILLPVLLLIITYEMFVFRQKKILYPKHGYVVNAMLAAGLSEDVVVSLGLLIDTLWEVGIDLLLVTFGFISTSLLSDVVKRLAV